MRVRFRMIFKYTEVDAARRMTCPQSYIWIPSFKHINYIYNSPVSWMSDVSDLVMGRFGYGPKWPVTDPTSVAAILRDVTVTDVPKYSKAE